MSEESRRAGKPKNPSGCDSRNCINIFDDSPGDTTVRPARPHLRKLAEAERERVRKWEQYLKENPPEPSDLVIGSNQGSGGSSGFNSHNAVNIMIDGPGDNTIRPIPPERLPHALKEKERIAKWEKYLRENPPQLPDAGQ